ncbi:MAG: XRE family transcriptional regulator [Helicobacteraceae bacterium]
MIGSKIREIRESNGISQKDFAKMFGVSYGTLQSYEYNKTNPDFVFVEKLSNHFNIDISFFLNDNMARNIKKATSKDYYTIPRLDVKASAGGGAEIVPLEEYETGQTLNIDKHFFKTPPSKNIKVMQVDGYSMIPMLLPDSWVIFEECNQWRGDGLYIINYNNQLMVKLLQLTPKKILEIISANKEYKSYSVDPDQETVLIVGKVIRAII